MAGSLPPVSSSSLWPPPPICREPPLPWQKLLVAFLSFASRLLFQKIYPKRLFWNKVNGYPFLSGQSPATQCESEHIVQQPETWIQHFRASFIIWSSWGIIWSDEPPWAAPGLVSEFLQPPLHHQLQGRGCQLKQWTDIDKSFASVTPGRWIFSSTSDPHWGHLVRLTMLTMLAMLSMLTILRPALEVPCQVCSTGGAGRYMLARIEDHLLRKEKSRKRLILGWKPPLIRIMSSVKCWFWVENHLCIWFLALLALPQYCCLIHIPWYQGCTHINILKRSFSLWTKLKIIHLLRANWALFCFYTAFWANCCVAARGKQNIPKKNCWSNFQNLAFAKHTHLKNISRQTLTEIVPKVKVK